MVGELKYKEGESEGEVVLGRNGEVSRGGGGAGQGNFRLTLHLWSFSIGKTGIYYIPSVLAHFIHALSVPLLLGP